MPHYTLCFAKDLTVGQETLFKTHLVGRHKKVTVDYWGQSRIEGLLFATEQGERIARAFYGDPTVDTQAIMRALRAGGPLASGEDVIERLAAIAEHLESKDPLYQYVTVTREVGMEAPPLNPGTIMAVESNVSGALVRLEAVPRVGAALERPPGGKLYLETKEADALQRFMAMGGELKLEETRFEFENLPSAFQEMNPGVAQGTVILQSERRVPPPWNARISMASSGGTATLGIHLAAGDLPDGWDAALRGQLAGLSAAMLFRSNEDRGQIKMEWSFRDTPGADTRTRSELLAFVEGLHLGGTMSVVDRDGHRPTLEFAVPEREIDNELLILRRYVESVLTIEDWIGATLPAPDVVPAAEFSALVRVAEIIRAGESQVNFESFSLTVTEEGYAALHEQESRGFGVEVEFGLAVLGTEIHVGVLRGVLDDVRIAEEREETDADGVRTMTVRLEPGSDEAHHPVFKLATTTPARWIGATAVPSRSGSANTPARARGSATPGGRSG